MKARIPFTGIAITLLLAPQGFAMTVSDALLSAREHSPELQRAQAAYDSSRWHKFETLGQGFLPKVTASANHYLAAKYAGLLINFTGTPLTFPNIYPDTTASIDAFLPLFDGFANIEQLSAASLQQEASLNELMRAQFVVDQRTRLAFYRALAASEIEGVSEADVKTLEDHLKLTNVERGSGAATNYDVLRVEVQLSEAQSDLIDARDAVATTREKLNEVMGLENDDRPLEGSLPVPEAERVKDLAFSDQLARERADLTALALRSNAADKLQEARSLWWVPQIGVGAEYSWYDLTSYNTASAALNYTGTFQTAYNVGFYVKWNIFDGGVSLARAREADYERTQTEMTEKKAQLELPYDFDYWKRRYLSNSARYLAKKLDLRRSEESVRLAREGERAGTRTSTEVLDAEVDLFRSRAGVVNAQSNAAEAQIELELALERRI